MQASFKFPEIPANSQRSETIKFYTAFTYFTLFTVQFP